MKKALKIAVDILMYIDFLFLMLHGTIHSMMAHGILGMVLFALFIVHNLLNLNFYCTFFKGKKSFSRIVLDVTNIVLLLLMILMAVSSIMMSGFVFEWSGVQGTQGWRTAHLMSSSWCFMVMSFHLGFHHEFILKSYERKFSTLQKVLYVIALIVVSAGGIAAFIKSQLFIYMFNTGGWRIAARNLFEGILEYLAITMGVCSICRLFSLILMKKKPDSRV